MIISKLSGGLGNQMFQYAAGRSLSVSNDSDLYLDISALGKQSERVNHTIRSFELDVFNIQAKIAPDKLLKPYQTIQAGGIQGRLGRLIKFPGRSKIFTEQKFSFDPSFFNLKGDIYLDGYWQSEKYFLNNENLIRREFSFKIIAGKNNVLVAEEIKKQVSVSVHIRRGDMVSNPEASLYHGNLSLDYYYEAIKILNKKIGSFKLFIFSDDTEYVLKNFKTEFPFDVVSGNTGFNSYMDMHLMSICNHHIIANSSFSWWGAWLGTGSDKQVICPQQWFLNNEIDTTDICPPSWIRI